MDRTPSSGEVHVALPRTTPEILAACTQALRAVRARQPDARTFAVTSAVRGEGRSTIAAGLAIATARNLGRRCVLIDLDVDSWHAGNAASEQREAELPARIWSHITWASADLGVLQLKELATGATLTRSDVGTIVSELLDHETDVVVDLSCLPPVGSADQFAPLFDVVVLVVRAGSTSEDAVRRASLTLGEPAVVLLNRKASAVPRWLHLGGRS